MTKQPRAGQRMGCRFKRRSDRTPGTGPVLNFTHWQNYIAEVEL